MRRSAGLASEPPPVARMLVLLLALIGGFAVIGGQLVRLALSSGPAQTIALSETIARNWSRPDIVDRNGMLLATDVATPSLYADPKLVLDADEVVERLRPLLPELDEADLLRQLREDGRRFVWIKRGLTPGLAQRIHDLGLPGLLFRKELRRVYPAGAMAPHLLGQVNVDNRGLSGIERLIDETERAQLVLAAVPSRAEPVRLSLDLAVQHAVRQELLDAVRRYRAKAATAVVLDPRTGAILAAVSVPDFDPNRPGDASEAQRLDRLMGGVYELGSIFKAFTVAMALDDGTATLASTFDAREPLTIASRRIDDFHGLKRIVSLAEVFIHSSNIGAARIALQTGTARQQDFLGRLGLTGRLELEGGAVAAPLLPRRWGEIETATIAYGHGLALAPVQFAAAAAALVNGGLRVRPSLLQRELAGPTDRVIGAETSAAVRALMRRNVADPKGTGRRADVPGLEIGGKTGTADIARSGRYAERSVIASFLAAFPMSAPRTVTLLTLFEPEPTVETLAQITAGANAAPASGRMIARIAPLLGAGKVQGAAGGTR